MSEHPVIFITTNNQLLKQPYKYSTVMNSGKNHHRPINSVRSASRRNRRSPARAACIARWKKPAVTGARVMDLQCFSEGIQRIAQHGAQGQGKCSIVREVQRDGLASVLEVGCDSCETTSLIETSKKIKRICRNK